MIGLRVDPELWFFLPPARRRREFAVAFDGTSSLGHLVEAAGIPLTEIGPLRGARGALSPGQLPADGDVIGIAAVLRPQRIDGWNGRLVLDVHLGALARRLRILGVDTAYPDEAGDPALVERANAERRLLLTQDRGLLKRRALWAGAYVRGTRPDDQLADVLGRFCPTLRPWTRCTACNGEVEEVGKDEVADAVEPGTLRTQDRFARCRTCGRVYWRGAHGRRLDRLVARFTG